MHSRVSSARPFRGRLGALTLAALAALPCSGAAQSFAPPTPVAADTDPRTLHPGDLLRLTVWRQPDLSGEFVIGADSSLTHPLYRAVKVGGVSLATAEARLRQFLTQFTTDPQFVIEPLVQVGVGGDVLRPNVYTLAPETSVTQALMLAGGPTERGRRDRVLVVRGDRILTVDLTRPNAAAAQMRARPGDQIIVERRRSIFREVIAPAITLTGSTAAILTVILRSYRR